MQSFSLGPYQVIVLRRSFQRSLTLRVPALNQLKVCCGRAVPLRSIVQFIHEKMDFVEACHKELQRQFAQMPVRAYQSGEKCPFLGQERELNVQVKAVKRARVELQSSQLILHVHQDEPQTVKSALQNFYKKSGTNYLSHLVQTRAKQMALPPNRLSFRSQRTRWGSCSSQGNISLNWRLIAASHEVMDYVVVHELAHLKHQNHSRHFWQLVETFHPDYREHKKWLRENHFLFDFLD